MKKCPECGNPSYDGAPVCGNCGYKFPKTKVAAPKRENIFQQEPKEKKSSNNDDIINIIKDNKLVIGAILLITIIVILGIVLTGSNNNGSSDSNAPLIQSNSLLEYSANGFSFKYPDTWNELNETDEEHIGAKFYQVDNDTIVEYYSVTSDSTSIKEISQSILSYAQEIGAYVELVETITLDGRNSSNIILENVDGDYTRYVSMFSDGQTYVFKITGSSINSITSEDIESTINSADIA
ncbi:PsbP-related protein [Methanobrevibacter sp.]